MLSEYGEVSTATEAMLTEDGKVVCENDAINQISQYFG
jgi:adapter protein MecA 1/2